LGEGGPLSIPKEFGYNVEEISNDDFQESLVTSNGSHNHAVQESSDEEEDYFDGEDNSYYEETEKGTNLQKTARQICQFFLTSREGDFAWPVASFPV